MAGRAAVALVSVLCTAGPAWAQAPDTGRRWYDGSCARCHGGDGNGGEKGPGIVTRLDARDDDALAALVRSGLPAAGMPAFEVPEPDLRELVAFLRTLRPSRALAPVRARVETTDGRTLDGVVLNRTAEDLQLRSDDRRIHLLRRAGTRYRPVTSQADWPTYHGQYGGNRFTALTQIDKTTVARLAPRWTYALGDTRRLEGTPVVVDGIMYVTAANECHALDAGNGRRLWDYR
ncbi:MAG TPA: c-type cytochrome, partial [Vicinamibacteria bacterium]|nr:c-type cytochrome [Vicinamibacteria bacterium]